MKPKNRQTDFGTFNEALRLTIFFEGQESDQYETFFGAFSLGKIALSRGFTHRP